MSWPSVRRRPAATGGQLPGRQERDAAAPVRARQRGRGFGPGPAVYHDRPVPHRRTGEQPMCGRCRPRIVKSRPGNGRGTPAA